MFNGKKSVERITRITEKKSRAYGGLRLCIFTHRLCGVMCYLPQRMCRLGGNCPKL